MVQPTYRRRNSYSRRTSVLILFLCTLILSTPGVLAAEASIYSAPALTVHMRIDFAQEIQHLLLWGIDGTIADGPLDLSLTWQETLVNWRPSYGLVLESSTGLLDRSLVIWEGRPVLGHVYDCWVSVDLDSGLVGVFLADLTTGQELYAGEQELAQGLGAAQGLSYTLKEEILHREINVQPVFLPVGASWDLVEITDTGAIPVTHFHRDKEMGIRLRSKSQLTGSLSFGVATPAGPKELYRTGGPQDQLVFPVALEDVPVGAVTLYMEYTEGPFQYTRTKEVTVGSVVVTLDELTPDQEAGVLRGAFLMVGDGSLAGLVLESWAEACHLTWDQVEGRAVPQYVQRLDLSVDTLQVSDREKRVTFEIPFGDLAALAPLKLEFHFVANAQVKNRIQEVILSDLTKPLSVAFPLPTSYELRCTVEALQGIVNRKGPRLYITTRDDRWLQLYSTLYDISYFTAPDVAWLFAHFREELQGIVLYDDQVDGSRYVALTIAGIDDLLPINEGLYRAYGETFAELDLPVLIDLRGQFESSVQAYDWVLEHVMPRANRSYAHAVNGVVEGVTAGCGPFAWFDWVVGHRGFIFNLACVPIPLESWGYTVGGDRAQAEMYRRILRELEPMAQIKGFGEPEWDWVNLIASFGHYAFHWGSNLSFHSKVPAKEPIKQQLRFTPENVDPTIDKYLVVFMTSEGDTMKGPIPFWSGSWFDPNRGKVAMNWGINPIMAEVTPAMLEYYYTTATEQDYFFAGVTGAGYTSIKHMTPEQMEDFAQHTAKAMQQADLHCVDVWQWQDYYTDLRRFIEIIQPLGVTILTKRPPEHVDGVPLAGHNFDYWNTKFNSVAQLAREIESVARGFPRPSIILIYTDMHNISNLPTLHKQIMDSLDPELFVAVRMDEAFSIMRARSQQ